MANRAEPPWEIGWLTAAAFAALAVVSRGAIPFFVYPMFAFEAPREPMAMPLFRADGEIDSPMAYEGFVGVGPEHVDLAHAPYPCTAEHLLHEFAQHLEQHQAPPGAPEGPVEVAVGLRLAHIRDDGTVEVVERIDKRGYAWRALR